jgi:hypothetical protein
MHTRGSAAAHSHSADTLGRITCHCHWAKNAAFNELGGVKPLAFGQYGELGPGFEQLLDQLAEEGVAEEYSLGVRPPCVAVCFSCS